MLTIGEFSRLSRVTPRMLRHYDALGLLRPQAVGENGYRYYRQEQLEELLKLRWLQGYGFSLGEIGPLLALGDEALLPYLRQRRQALCQELSDRQALLRRLEADILHMEGKNMMDSQYHVILLQDPAQKVFSIRERAGVDQFHGLFQRLYEEAARRGLTQAGPIQMLYHDDTFDPAGADVEVQMVVAKDGPDVTVRPACTCAAVRHRGPYPLLQRAYDALCAWMARHPDYRLCGPALERYLNSPDDTPPDQLETGVLFPVERQ